MRETAEMTQDQPWHLFIHEGEEVTTETYATEAGAKAAAQRYRDSQVDTHILRAYTRTVDGAEITTYSEEALSLEGRSKLNALAKQFVEEAKAAENPEA